MRAGLLIALVLGVFLAVPQSSLSQTRNLKIINGFSASTRKSGVVLVLENAGGGQYYICSGSMLNRTAVLTAAHCVTKRASKMTVRVQGRAMQVKRVLVHPEAYENEWQGLVYNDVAIIRLKRSVRAPVVPILVSRKASSGDIVQIYGYGLDERSNAGRLKAGYSYVERVTDSHVVSVFDGVDSNTCNGDSGGPAIDSYTDDLGHVHRGMVGITSSGTIESCGIGDRTFFTNIQSDRVLDFILSKVPNAKLQ